MKYLKYFSVILKILYFGLLNRGIFFENLFIFSIFVGVEGTQNTESSPLSRNRGRTGVTSCSQMITITHYQLANRY